MVEEERAKSPLARRREREGRVSRPVSVEQHDPPSLPQEPLPNTSIQDWTEQDMDDDFEAVPAAVLLRHPLAPCNNPTESQPFSPGYQFDLKSLEDSPQGAVEAYSADQAVSAPADDAAADETTSKRSKNPLAQRREREGRRVVKLDRRPSQSLNESANDARCGIDKRIAEDLKEEADSVQPVDHKPTAEPASSVERPAAPVPEIAGFAQTKHGGGRPRSLSGDVTERPLRRSGVAQKVADFLAADDEEDTIETPRMEFSASLATGSELLQMLQETPSAAVASSPSDDSPSFELPAIDTAELEVEPAVTAEVKKPALNLEQILREHEPQQKPKSTGRRKSVLSRRREKEAAAESNQQEVQQMMVNERRALEDKMYDEDDDGSYWRQRAGGVTPRAAGGVTPTSQVPSTSHTQQPCEESEAKVEFRASVIKDEEAARKALEQEMLDITSPDAAPRELSIEEKETKATVAAERADRAKLQAHQGELAQMARESLEREEAERLTREEAEKAATQLQREEAAALALKAHKEEDEEARELVKRDQARHAAEKEAVTQEPEHAADSDLPELDQQAQKEAQRLAMMKKQMDSARIRRRSMVAEAEEAREAEQAQEAVNQQREGEAKEELRRREERDAVIKRRADGMKAEQEALRAREEMETLGSPRVAHSAVLDCEPVDADRPSAAASPEIDQVESDLKAELERARIAAAVQEEEQKRTAREEQELLGSSSSRETQQKLIEEQERAQMEREAREEEEAETLLRAEAERNAHELLQIAERDAQQAKAVHDEEEARRVLRERHELEQREIQKEKAQQELHKKQIEEENAREMERKQAAEKVLQAETEARLLHEASVKASQVKEREAHEQAEKVKKISEAEREAENTQKQADAAVQKEATERHERAVTAELEARRLREELEARRLQEEEAQRQPTREEEQDQATQEEEPVDVDSEDERTQQQQREAVLKEKQAAEMAALRKKQKDEVLARLRAEQETEESISVLDLASTSSNPTPANDSEPKAETSSDQQTQQAARSNGEFRNEREPTGEEAHILEALTTERDELKRADLKHSLNKLKQEESDIRMEEAIKTARSENSQTCTRVDSMLHEAVGEMQRNCLSTEAAKLGLLVEELDHIRMTIHGKGLDQQSSNSRPLETIEKQHARDCIRNFEAGQLPTSRTLLRNLSPTRTGVSKPDRADGNGSQTGQRSASPNKTGTFAARVSAPIQLHECRSTMPPKSTGQRKLDRLLQVENYKPCVGRQAPGAAVGLLTKAVKDEIMAAYHSEPIATLEKLPLLPFNCREMLTFLRTELLNKIRIRSSIKLQVVRDIISVQANPNLDNLAQICKKIQMVHPQ